MTIQEWRIPLRDAQHEQYGLAVTHGRKPDPKSPSGKTYWYSIDGKPGLNKMPKTELPLYAWERLNENDTYVVITEGEKAADALLDRGVVAVGTATGASGKTIPCDESLKVALGRTVYLWADNDDAGRKHMDAITTQLFRLGAKDVRVVEWAESPHKGDAADFTGDDERLLALIQAATPRERYGDLSEILKDICAFINKYVVMLPVQVDAAALWVIHTYTWSVCDTTPYLSISSAVKGSGKTRLFEVLEELVANPWNLAGATGAVMYRGIDQYKPTLLFDEVDTTFKGDRETAQAIRQVLNAGSRRGGSIPRMVGQGTNMTVQKFNVFCPKAFAGIGKDTLPDTVFDRSIPFNMKRKTTLEETPRFRRRNAKQEAAPLKERIEAWAEYNTEAIGEAIEADPDLPKELSDRASDHWEPLIAIADLAGESWGNRARHAAITLINPDDEDSVDLLILRDIHRVFDVKGNPASITSKDLLEALKNIEESPWNDWDLTTTKLARKYLRGFGVKPRTIRFPDNPKTYKGYRREDFLEPWSRNTPGVAVTAVTKSQAELEIKQQSELNVTDVTDVTTESSRMMFH